MDYDLVYKSPNVLIVRKNDNWYEANRDDIVPITIYDVKTKVCARPSASHNIDLLIEKFDATSDPMGFLISHFAREFKRFTICDVGSHYGETTMDFARTSIKFGGDARIFAFDAGAAANLTKRNLENNGFPEIVFEEVAVGSFDGHGLMYGAQNESTGNRVILGGDFSYPVKFISLDTYLASHNAMGPAVVKIDVQGAEPLVLAGMKTLRRDYPVGIFLEFTPWALRDSGFDPAEILKGLGETHELFDAGYNREHLKRIVDFAGHVFTVDSHAPHWRDILAIPRNFPGYEAMVAKLGQTA